MLMRHLSRWTWNENECGELWTRGFGIVLLAITDAPNKHLADFSCQGFLETAAAAAAPSCCYFHLICLSMVLVDATACRATGGDGLIVLQSKSPLVSIKAYYSRFLIDASPSRA